jgi:hypothetical protein
MSRTRIHRYIAAFDKNSDVLIEKCPLSKGEFEIIRSLLGNDPSDPMYDCYPLKGHVLEKVFALVDRRLKTRDHEYFLETESL